MGRINQSQRLLVPFILLAYAVACFATQFALESIQLPVIYAPAGILWVGLVLTTRREWLVLVPAVFFIKLVGELLIYGNSVEIALLYSSAKIIEAVLGVMIVQRLTQVAWSWDAVKHILQFIVVAVLVLPAIFAGIPAFFIDPSYYFQWALISSSGVIIVAPAFQLLYQFLFIDRRLFETDRPLEALISAGVLISICLAAFVYRYDQIYFMYFVSPVMILLATRFGRIGAGLGNLCAGLIASVAIIVVHNQIQIDVARYEHVSSLLLFLIVTGTTSLLLGALIDERKRALQIMLLQADKLSRASTEWQATFDSLQEMISIQDEDCNIVKVNKAFAEVHNMLPTELIGRNYGELTGNFSSPVDTGALERCMRVRTIQNAAFYDPALSRHLEVKLYPLLDTRERFAGVVRVAEDVTRKKEEEAAYEVLLDQFLEAQKTEEIGKLARGIAHDFNNILSLIIGNADIALLELPVESRAREYLDNVLSTSEKARLLVSQLMSFSRQAMNMQVPTKPQDLINESLNLLRASTPTTISFESSVSEECSNILGDRNQVSQLLFNLYSNAIASMDGSGQLRVSLQEVDSLPNDLLISADKSGAARYIEIAVTDDGCGMDKDTKSRILDPFFTTKGPDGGTGIGLSVVTSIVNSHGAALKIDSEPGEGTTVFVYFPIVDETVQVDPVIPRLSVPGNERILLVDDLEALAKIESRILSSEGYRVTTRVNGLAALKVFEDDPDKFDLVLTDQTMPNITGTELARKLQELRSDIPIVLLSGFSTPSLVEEVKDIGIKAFCIKPMSAHQITGIVRQVLDEVKNEPALHS